jgi:hypothetical protein
MKRYLFLVAGLIILGSCFSQKIEIEDTKGNLYVGRLISDNDTTVCIRTKNGNKICFDTTEVTTYGQFRAYNRAYPLTKDLNPVVMAHDIGVVLRTNIGGVGVYYSFSAQKRLNDHLSVGLEACLGLGDFLEVNLRAIGTYQLNPESHRVSAFSLSTGPFKEFVYWSEGGFDINASYTLLLRKERNKSRRLTFSTGFYSAKYNWCAGGPDCIPYVHRTNELQFRIGYGWQF